MFRVLPAPAPEPAVPAAQDDDSPIRAANEPAIKAALKAFGGTISAITPPPVRQMPETVEDTDDIIDEPSDDPAMD